VLRLSRSAFGPSLGWLLKRVASIRVLRFGRFASGAPLRTVHSECFAPDASIRVLRFGRSTPDGSLRTVHSGYYTPDDSLRVSLRVLRSRCLAPGATSFTFSLVSLLRTSYSLYRFPRWAVEVANFCRRLPCRGDPVRAWSA
jgi:hypothetical protein